MQAAFRSLAFLMLFAVSAQAADPPNLEVLGSRPSLWPKQVALKEPLTFKNTSGAAVQLPVGTVGDVISIQAQGVGIDFNGTTLLVPAGKTDLAERLPQQAALAAEEAKKREAIRAAMPKPTPPMARKLDPAQRQAYAGTDFIRSFEDKLIIDREGTLVLLPPDSLSRAKYLAFYFSAGWCGPCRKFTPGLVEFYNKLHAQNKNFEVIFVSSDRSKDAMSQYLFQEKMPWPAVAFEALNLVQPVMALAGNGIPCLVVTDREGKVISHSYENGEYVGPRKVVQDLDRLLAAEQKQ